MTMEIDCRVTGKTRVICLIGNPIGHSISPQLHNSFSSLLGIDLIYIPFKVEKQNLENAIKGLKALDVVGFNVTVPFKKDVMKFLDDNSKEALLVGAVNTVKNIDGRLYGYNTDSEGFLRSFREEAGEGFKGKQVAVIGAGGAARAITVKVAKEGAKKIYIINRTLSKANDIAEVVNNNYGHIAECIGLDDNSCTGVIEKSSIIINTTSVGMYPEVENVPVENIKFNKNQVVYDVIYNPPKTRFLIEAEKAGCRVVNGLGMLFYQGLYAYEIWTGVKLTEEKIREMYRSFVQFKTSLEGF